MGRLEERLQALPPTPDVQVLQDLLRDLGGGAQSQILAQSETTREELERILRARMSAVTPWTGDVAALRGLPVPADEDVDHALTRIDRARTQSEAEAQACIRDAARLEGLELDRRHATLAHPAPAREALATARAARDGAWAPLRAQLRGEASLDDAPAASDAYEQTVSDSDRLADERFAGAEHAGSLAALERDIEKSALQLTQSQARRDGAAAEVMAALAAFAELVSGIGIALTPEAYGAWSDARAEALQTADGLDLALRDLQRAKDADADARHTLLAALVGTEVRDEAAPLRQLLTGAERIVGAATEVRTQARELRAELNAGNETMDRAAAQAKSAAEAEAQWAAAWTPALQRTGLPADASVASARA